MDQPGYAPVLDRDNLLKVRRVLQKRPELRLGRAVGIPLQSAKEGHDVLVLKQLVEDGALTQEDDAAEDVEQVPQTILVFEILAGREIEWQPPRQVW